jgi:pimeloyl-ACP methyl ester carboxylesterase
MRAPNRWNVIEAAAYVAAIAAGVFCMSGKAEAVVLEPLPTGWVREPSGGLTDVGLAATPFEGKVYAFAKGFEGHIWLQTYDPNRRAWLGAWQEVPGGGTTNVALAATATSDTLYLFAKGKDDKQVYVNKKHWGGGPLDGWSGWFTEHLPAGQTDVAVAAAATRDGIVSLFRTDPRVGQVFVTQRDLLGYWRPWEPAPIPATYTSPAAAVDDDTGTLYVFSVGRETHDIYMNSRHVGAWSTSYAVRDANAKTYTGVAAAASGGKLQMFHSGLYHGLRADRRIRAQQYSGERAIWSGAADLPGEGRTDVTPAVARLGSGLMVFVKGIQEQAIYYSFFSDSQIVSEVSTRDHYDTESTNLKASHTLYDYRTIGSIPGFTPGTTPPAEIAIVVHGWDNQPTEAQTRFQRARASLRILGYQGPVVGFTWDSNTGWGPSNAFGFDEGKAIAISNGRKLANFIDTFRARCPNTKIHLMGHSMGTRVVLEAIYALGYDGYYAWNRQLAGTRIDDVHLLGAAVDNEEPQMNARYGQAIWFEVGRCFNYYDPEDDILEFLYPPEEGDYALGETGIEERFQKPFNYTDVNVQSLIPHGGDDHFAYWGYRPEDITDDAGTLPPTLVRQESVGAMPAVRANFQ